MYKQPKGVKYRMSDSAPLYALIIMVGGIITSSACLWGLIRLVGMLL